jgi:hypothetical protein
MLDKTRDFVFDIETYKTAFTFSIVRGDGKFPATFEVSFRCNEFDRVLKACDTMINNNYRLVGFNNIGFDYPILHELLINREKYSSMSGKQLALKVHQLAQKQIDSYKDGFGNTIKSDECLIKQVDLYRIHHFNNKAKATSLKLLEFNMRMPDIQDLPFPVDATLTGEQIDKLKEYNAHDVYCTRMFYEASESQISFRDDLSLKLGKDFTNHDDTKIGAEYFQMELEKNNVKTYVFKNGKRVMAQTPRDKIKIGECLFDYLKFTRPEFQALHKWFASQIIHETNGVFSNLPEHKLGDVAKYAEMVVKRKKFKTKPTDYDIAEFKSEYPLGWIEEEELKATEYAFDADGNHVLEPVLDAFGNVDKKKKPKKKRIPKKSYWMCWNEAETLNVVINGFRYDYGVGGIHGSLSSKVVVENRSYLLRDADVSSMYPNLSIRNNLYPQHLGETFCKVYEDMYNQRKSYGKKTAENAMLKLALNGTYGKSNDKYSVFYDPKFTMSVTIGGQLSLSMLIDMLLVRVPNILMIQCNTDGITVAIPREHEHLYNTVCDEWQKITKLDLEFVDYKSMYISNVNNYLAVYTDGKTKNKGMYEYKDLAWHKNQSALIIPMAAEAAMVHGKDLREFIMNHPDKYDFMLRTKVPRSSKLVLVNQDGTETQLQNICRYYPCKTGGKLVKIMPPLEEGGEDRRLGIDTEWNVKPCNNILDFADDVNYEYYINEAEKLIIKKEK